ncbi:MAG TPA: FG-GAP-like repeat-containing protein [Vicinamibacterales bacterium]|nr:FG-GAP-like repeat-containing protein [Vicinamibacterales bacterium]
MMPAIRLALAILALLASGSSALAGSPQQAPAGQPDLGTPPIAPSDVSALRALEAAKPAGRDLQKDGLPLAVSPASREDARTFYLTYYQNAAAPAHGWTGSRAGCVAGTTTQAFRDAILLRINFFRAMAGVPAAIAFSDAYNAKAQQAALMMSVNGALNHDPPATWTCYTAEGDQAAGSSNLALGTYGWSAITGYMKDPGTSNGAAGHRRWILYPQTQTMGTGDVPSEGGWAANDLWVFDSHMWEPRPATREAFVAWPPPGFVPYQVVFPRWSFSYDGADFSQATITMTQGGQSVPLTLEAVRNGYGENTIVWIPNGLSSSGTWPKPEQDTAYSITIGNVLVSGSPRSFTYDVIVMDPAQPTPPPVHADFTGDRKSDIFWRHATLGDMWLWPMHGASKTSDEFAGTVPDPAWRIRSIGDQTGDGKADLLWRHETTGQLYFWPMHSPLAVRDIYVGAVDPSFDIAGYGDFSGDGKSDLLWRRAADGELWIWLMNVATPTSQAYLATVDPAYAVAGIGDLDADGKADIVWRGAAAGDVWAWTMDGVTRTAQALIGTVGDLEYRIEGVADFTGDGRADILWRHASTGDVWLWEMNGAARAAESWVATVGDTHYRIADVGDYDGDGRADILWRHAVHGDIWVWFMDGAARASEAFVGTVGDQGYQIVR